MKLMSWEEQPNILWERVSFNANGEDRSRREEICEPLSAVLMCILTLHSDDSPFTCIKCKKHQFLIA